MPNTEPASRETAAQPPVRRTQQQRRDQTITRLLDATIQSVLDVGYAATTTRRVAELAGVSPGAQSHHFPRRVDLVGAAVERLAERRVTELRELAQDFPRAREQRLAALLDLIWADYSSPVFTVFVKLWVAAADDQELYTRLVPVERQLARAIAAAAEDFAGELVDRPEWANAMLMTLTAIRGLALGEQFEPRGQRRRDPWPELRSALLQAFAKIR